MSPQASAQLEPISILSALPCRVCVYVCVCARGGAARGVMAVCAPRRRCVRVSAGTQQGAGEVAGGAGGGSALRGEVELLKPFEKPYNADLGAQVTAI
jgi:hypothetical protein